jgi:hypothetical protein
MQRRSQIHSFDYANSIAVSPNGDIVFAIGNSQEETGEALPTLAYNTCTGHQLWVQRWFDGSGFAVAASPHGDTVFVTGSSTRATSGSRLRHGRLQRLIFPPGADRESSPSPRCPPWSLVIGCLI